MNRLLPLALAVALAVIPVGARAQPRAGKAPPPGLTQAQEGERDLPLPRLLSLAAPDSRDKLAALAARPSTPGNALALGIMRALAGQYAQAAQTLAPVKAELPSMAGWAGLYLGYAKYRLGDFQGAADELAAVNATDPAVGPDALLLAAYCLEGLGTTQARALALEKYRRFLALAGQPMRPAALWRAAALAASGGDYAGAEQYLRELLLVWPWTVSAGKAEPLARELFRSGSGAFDPESPDSLRQRIEALLDKSQTAKAIPLLDRLEGAPGADPARVLYLKAKALFARRDTQGAIQLFEDAARLANDPVLGAWSVYHQARCMWRLSGPEDAARMEELLTEALHRGSELADGSELVEASRRLLMLSRLERGRFQDALAVAADLAAAGPEPTEAREQAAWLSGLMRFALGDLPGAGADLKAFREAYPDSDYAPAAHYWEGRVLEAQGDPGRAADAMRVVLARWPNGYYGMLAAKRLSALGAAAGPPPAPEPAPEPARPQGPETSPATALTSGGAGPVKAPIVGREPPKAPQTPCPGAEPPPAPPEAAPSLKRAAILEEGLLPELAERELAALNDRMPRDPAVALRYARLALGLGGHRNAVRAVSRAFRDCLARGTREELEPLRDIVYPDRYPELIAANLAGSGVDPDIIRGLIRQESFFEPGAVSGAGAMGLMQVLPSTARSQAEKYGEKGFKPESLKDPAVNIRYGVRFFLERYREYDGNLPLTLASYNAGRVKIGVWRQFLGGLDPELFVEFIPYSETRDYVKRILADRAMYALLH